MMLKLAFVSLALLSLALAADAGAQSVKSDTRPTIGPAKPDFFNRVIANQKKGEAALDLYERIERVETRKHPNDAAPVAIKISRVIPSGTGMVRIPLGTGTDSKPSDSGAYRAELEGLARVLAVLVNDSGSQRDALEKYAKKRKDRNDLIDATHNAFQFTFVANEPRGARTLSKYRMEPNPGFKPTSRLTAIFPKVRGFVWVDEACGELARMEGDVTEDISIGLFLGKIYKAATSCRSAMNFCPACGSPAFRSTISTAANYFPPSPATSALFIRSTATSAPPRKPSRPFARNSGTPSWASRTRTPPITETFLLKWV